MKTIFLFLFTIILFTSCKEPEPIETKIDLDGMFNITKTDVGFNIYSNTGELILEFTKRNSDSLSLRTLDYIYETAREFYNQEEIKPEEKTKSI
jgi:hypothetical protein